MAKGKRVGKGHDGRYAAYKSSGTYATNRRKRLERALKENPENEQIALAMKSIVYRRSTPVNKEWSPTKRRLAGLFKEFTGKVNKDIFSNNEKTAAAALMTPGPKSVKLAEVKGKRHAASMFSFTERLVA